MEALNLKSDLQRYIDAVPAKRRDALGQTEFNAAVEMYCTEVSHYTGKLRHADTIDFDRDQMRAVFDLVPRLLTAKREGRDRDVLALQARIGAITTAAVLSAVSDRLDDYFWEKSRPLEARLQDDHHALEYEGERIAARNAMNDRLREALHEVAR